MAGCGSSNSTPPVTSTSTSTAAASGSNGATLYGSDGPSSISLTQGGTPVTTLPAGTYTLKVNDQSENDNFHLTGPGVEVGTDIFFAGTKTFTITLKAGKYHYQCDAHASTEHGDFTVS
jgi:hypothetical protein